MKHIKFLLSATILATFMFISCKDDSETTDPEENRTKTEILSTGKWYTSSYATKNPGQAVNEYVDRSLDCQKDDGIIFSSNGKITFINPVKCKQGEAADGFQDDWYFDNTAQTIINISKLNYPVVSITKDEIKLHKIFSDSSELWWNFKPLK